MPRLNKQRMNYLPDKPKRKRVRRAGRVHALNRWTVKSLRYRKRNPRCEVHEHFGQVETTKIEVDHIIRDVDGGAGFNDDNLMTLCRECHKYKSRLEKQRGILVQWKENERGERVPEDREAVFRLFEKRFEQLYDTPNL